MPESLERYPGMIGTKVRFECEITPGIFSQAAELQKQIVVAKGRYAPNGRGTIATGTRENVGVLIQSGSTSSKRIAKNA